MNESGDTAPPPQATFESLEAELEKVTRRLEDPSVPLEERLKLHASAASLHRRLEAIVEAARKAIAEPGKDTARESRPGGEDTAEPYEKVRDRLAAVVNALEAEDLPLGRIIELHREAQSLAARCEAILDGARDQVAQAATGSGADDSSPVRPDPDWDAAV